MVTPEARGLGGLAAIRGLARMVSVPPASGSNSMVESQPSKLLVASSILVSRSINKGLRRRQKSLLQRNYNVTPGRAAKVLDPRECGRHRKVQILPFWRYPVPNRDNFFHPPNLPPCPMGATSQAAGDAPR